jgi:low affinity Fe/Cu permease
MARNKNSLFMRFAKKASSYTGKPAMFMLAVLVILAWAISGPLFNFSDTWQLVINTSTTIVTFLMVFLIQNTQNRDSEALQIKLDEIIRSLDSASNIMLNLEELEDDELDTIRERYLALARKEREDNPPEKN